MIVGLILRGIPFRDLSKETSNEYPILPKRITAAKASLIFVESSNDQLAFESQLISFCPADDRRWWGYQRGNPRLVPDPFSLGAGGSSSLGAGGPLPLGGRRGCLPSRIFLIWHLTETVVPIHSV